jgi:hypothetical protein
MGVLAGMGKVSTSDCSPETDLPGIDMKFRAGIGLEMPQAYGCALMRARCVLPTDAPASAVRWSQHG